MNIVAYGSLMNQRSLENTLSRRADLKPITIEGYARVFNAPFDNYAFLNVQLSNGAQMECVYFEIKPAEIIKFAVRESGSELVELAAGYYAFMWPEHAIRHLPVLRSYIDICHAAAQELSLDFERGTIWPNVIEEDRTYPKYLA